MPELDRETLDACRRGDVRAFRALVLAYQQVVISLCTALAGADGEDLAQETFVRVHAAIGRFDPDGPAGVRTWILVIARRLCRDRARQLQRRRDAGEPASPVGASDPRRELEHAQQSQAVADAIAALPVEQRAVLALREW